MNARVTVDRTRASTLLVIVAPSHAVTTLSARGTGAGTAASVISVGTDTSYGPTGPALTVTLECCCVIANATRAITTSTAASANPPSNEADERTASRPRLRRR